MITISEHDVTCTVTADAFRGFHGTGMVERGYETITLRASDYEPDEAARTGAENQEWWTNVLAAFAAYQRFVAEAFPDTLLTQARACGYDSFEDWTEGLSQSLDLEREADLCYLFITEG